MEIECTASYHMRWFSCLVNVTLLMSCADRPCIATRVPCAMRPCYTLTLTVVIHVIRTLHSRSCFRISLRGYADSLQIYFNNPTSSSLQGATTSTECRELLVGNKPRVQRRGWSSVCLGAFAGRALKRREPNKLRRRSENWFVSGGYKLESVKSVSEFTVLFQKSLPYLLEPISVCDSAV